MAPDSATQMPLKTSRRSDRSDDFPQNGQRGSHDVQPADQLIRPPVGIDTIDHQRLHLETLRAEAHGFSKPAGDVFKQQSVLFALPPRQLGQFLPQPAIRQPAASLDN